MPDLDHNIDDLFRRAARDCPVQPGPDQWEKIIPRLTVSADALIDREKSSGQKKRLIRIFFLFLFLAGGSYLLFFNNAGQQVNEGESAGQTNITRQLPSHFLPAEPRNEDRHSRLSDEPNPRNTNQKSRADSRQDKSISPTGGSTVHLTGEFTPLAEFIARSSAQAIEGDHFAITWQFMNNRAAEKNNLPAGVKKNSTDPPLVIGKLFEQSFIPRVAKTDVPVQLQKRNGLYFGLSTGMSFHEVKSQGMYKPGFAVGLIAGYKFAGKFAFETGVQLARKYYFSDGKYFDTSGMGMEVMSLRGSSTLFELPVKIKYDMLAKGNSVFFMSAGFNSYLLTKETNDYHAKINGTEQAMKGVYDKSSRYFAASLDISVGYEHRFRKLAGRIQPYIQIPLKGIGVGSLPVTGAGLHIGITLPAY